MVKAWYRYIEGEESLGHVLAVLDEVRLIW